MKLPQTKSKKIILISLAVATVLALSAVTYVYAFNGSIFGWNNKTRTVNDVDYGNATDEQTKAGSEIKDNNQSDDPNKVGSDKPLDPKSNNSEKNTVPVAISAAGQNGSVAQIRTLISATVNDGTCTLTLTQGTKSVTKTADIQSLPSSATCKGFDIPVSELSAGKWQVTVTYENSTIKSSASGSITVQEIVQ